MFNKITDTDEPLPRKYKLWYSAKQRQAINTSRSASRPCYGKLEDGRIVEYTEAKISDEPSGFNDAVYLGEGDFYGHSPE